METYLVENAKNFIVSIIFGVILFYEKLLVNLLTWFDLSALILIDQSSFTNVTHINLYFRLRLKFSCMMELSRYPLDRQICDMQIASCK